jgi:hypothetical protein
MNHLIRQNKILIRGENRKKFNIGGNSKVKQQRNKQSTVLISSLNQKHYLLSSTNRSNFDQKTADCS